jgi:hypothetical protein
LGGAWCTPSRHSATLRTVSGVGCALSHHSCHVTNGQRHSTVLSGHTPCQPHGAALLSCIVVALPHVLQAMMMPPVLTSCRSLGNARACLETREPSCVARAAKPFFISVVHNPLRVVGHVTAPELSPREGRVRSREAHGSVGALPCKEVRSGAEEHVAASEPT